MAVARLACEHKVPGERPDARLPVLRARHRPTRGPQQRGPQAALQPRLCPALPGRRPDPLPRPAPRRPGLGDRPVPLPVLGPRRCGGYGRAPSSNITGVSRSAEMARTTARRSAASSPASPTVELTNTRSRWSGVRMTPRPASPGSPIVPGGSHRASLERAGSTGNPAPPTPPWRSPAPADPAVSGPTSSVQPGTTRPRHSCSGPGGESALLAEEAELLGVPDRLAPGRGAELSVDRERLGLRRVPGDEQALADLPEGQVAGQQRQ